MAIVDETQLSGQYLVDANLASLGSGIYYYVLEFESKKLVKKMVVIE
jgi:hypothetical protein